MQTNPNKRTISVEEAGEALGLSRASAYAAAKRGEIPSIRFGRRLVVPIVLFEAMLNGNSKGPHR